MPKPDTRSIRVRFKAFTAYEELINTKGMQAEARKLVQDHLDLVVSNVIEYPREYPKRYKKKNYVRTRRLYKGWRTSLYKRSRGYAGAIYNKAPYATFVQGPYQVWYHRGWGWRALEDYLMRDELQKKVKRFGRKLFWNVPMR